jgi:predicted DNA-binding transcriptional regulator AlpA
MERLLDQNEAARLLGLSVRTLERHRVTGTGPRFTRIGRLVRYRSCDLADFVEQNLRTSTSETPQMPTSTHHSDF